jgi:hypothetical protein
MSLWIGILSLTLALGDGVVWTCFHLVLLSMTVILGMRNLLALRSWRGTRQCRPSRGSDHDSVVDHLLPYCL